MFINLRKNISINILTSVPYFNNMLKFDSLIIFNYSFYTIFRERVKPLGISCFIDLKFILF